MKKKGKKIVAVLMAVLMIVGIMPMDWAAVKADAAETFVDASKQGTAKDGLTQSLSASNYFVINKGVKITETDKTIEGKRFTKRMQTNGVGNKDEKSIAFNVTGNSATVTVYAAQSGGEDGDIRHVVLYKATGQNDTLVAISPDMAKNGGTNSAAPATRKFTFEITSAGQYYLTADVSGIDIYYVGVTEAPTGTVTTSNASVSEKDASTWNLTWDESDVTGTPNVNVYYSLDGADDVKLGSVDAGTKTYDVDMTDLKSGSYVFKIVGSDADNKAVTNAKNWVQPRKAWDSVSNPSATAVVNTETNKIDVTYTMEMGTNGADSLDIILMDGENEVSKETVKAENTATKSLNAPSASGTYSIKLVAKRDDAADKVVVDAATVNYALPLQEPTISSVTGDGKNSVSLIWKSVTEADKYDVYYKVEGTDEYTKATTATTTTATVTGLTVGKVYTLKVVAVRANPESSKEAIVNKNFTSEVERVWTKAYVGTQAETNEKSGAINVNTNGSVTMDAPAGKMASSNDGYSFYYTKVKSDEENFVFSAKVTIDSFSGDNQSGVGLLVADSIGEDGKNDLCCEMNYLLAGLSKTEWVDEETGAKTTYSTAPSFRKVTGCADNKGVDSTGRTLNQANPFIRDLSSDKILTANTFKAGTVDKEYTFTLTKDNNGYHATLASADGVVLHSYDPSKMLQQDNEYVYVGLAASRKIKATFSDISFESRKPSDDPAADPNTWEKDYTPQKLFVYAGDSTSQEDYTYRYYGNWDGNVTLKDGEGNVIFSKDVAAEETITETIKLTQKTTKLITTVTPDKDKVVLKSYDPVVIEKSVTMNKYGKEGETIIVSTTGTSSGDGTEENPLDIYTAVKYAQPGQVILLKNGTYYLDRDIKIPYSVSGREDAMITMMAETAGKVSLDGTKIDQTSTGSMVAVNGDYWHLYGIEICNSGKLEKGIQVSGNHNIIEFCDIHNNGTTGLQISRSGGEPKAWWPTYNLIKNCSSYNNCDVALNDADGFGAKLTVGVGNKFYGCMAYNNIDDGWDLYAKNEAGQGAISPVVIENCVAFNNGWVPGVEGLGEGNGFKLGGEGLPGAHQLINSITFNNGAKGIASNNGPDCQVINCTSFNNNLFYATDKAQKSSYNINLSPLNGEKYAGTTGYVLKNTISYYTFAKGLADQVTLKGQESIASDNTYLVNDSLKSVNMSGEEVSADWFTSIDTTVLPTRNQNGTINMHNLLALTSKAPEGVGANIDTTSDTAISNSPEVTKIVDATIEKDTQVAVSVEGIENVIKDAKIDWDAVVKREDGTIVPISDVHVKIEGATEAVVEKVNEVFVENGVDISKAVGLKYYEIDLTDNTGAVVKLESGKVQITLGVDETVDLTQYTAVVYHVKDDGSLEKMDAKLTDNGIVFVTDSFSPYVVMYVPVSENAGDSTPTGDTTNAAPFAIMMILGVAMVSGVYYFDKKRKTVTKR